MKNILIIFFLFLCYNVVAQNNPSGVPTQYSTGWFRHGWDQNDSGLIIAPRIPNFTPRFPGTTILYQHAGVDSNLNFWNGARWIDLIPGFDSTNLSNRINLKLNITDTTNKWWSINKRFVDTVYRVNDSTIGFTINNGSQQTFQILGRTSGGGGGSGTVTSVALSMPSAFSVSGSPITTSGTFAVSGAGTTSQYIRGNGTLATFDTTAIPTFSAKVRSLFSGTSPITYNQSSGAIGITNANTSGTKGAATFNNSDFSDDGSGTISLSTLVSAGSCTGCTLNIGIDGRITGYSDGAGGATNNTNIGSGFRVLSNPTNQTLRTLFSGFGTAIDSISNSNGLTWKADTSRVTGLPSYYYVDSLVGTGGGITGSGANTQVTFWTGTSTVSGDGGFTYNSTSNTITVDSAIFIKNKQDSSQYNSHAIPYGRVSQINFFGNSITQYLNAVPNDSAYDLLIADTLNAYWQNYALSGMGVFYACQKHDSIIQGPNNNAATSVMIGYNDCRVTSVGPRTFKKIASGIKSMFLNHFANFYIPASTTAPDTSVTRYGSFTTGQDAMQWAGKTKNAAYTSTINDSIVWKSQPATTIGIGLIAGDSLLYNHSIVEIFIDGISQGEYNTNNIADSAALIGPPNTRIPYAIIIGGLSNAPHTIKLVNKASRIMYVDYFTSLDSKKPSFIIFHNIKGTPSGQADQLAGNAAIDSMATTLPNGFPFMVVKTNNFWNYTTGMSSDSVHPNNIGHHQIYNAFRSVYDSVVATNGILMFDGINLWISGGGTMQKIVNPSDVWTKGDAAMNIAGYINLPYYMSIKQNGTDILKTDEYLQRTNVGYHAGYLQTTATGNTAIGHSALGSATTGGANTGIGQNALGSLTTGTNNTGIGYQSAYSMTTGDGITAIGMYSLFSNSSGSNNTAIGKQALFANVNGSDNTANGYEALSVGTSGSENTAMGYFSLKNTTGSGNIGIGVHAMEINTSGSYNTAIGRYAMFFHAAGAGNTAIGNGALYGTNTSKDYNTGIGYGVLGSIDGGSYNTAMGYNVADNLTTASKCIFIGNDIDAPSATTDGQMSIGNLIYGTSINGTGTTVSSGNVGIGIASPSTRLHVNGKLSVNTHTIAANSDSAVVRVYATGEYQYAKINGGISSLNTLTASTQTFATGTSGSDFAISSSSSTHTFNIPDAGTSARGLITTTSQTLGGKKTFNDGAIVTFPTASSATSLVVSGNRSVSSAPGIGGIELQLASFTYTNTEGATTETQGQNFNLVGIPTLTSSNAISYSGDVSTIRFSGAPIAAGSTTIDHPWNIFANDVNYFQTLAMGVNEQSGDATLGNGSNVIYTGTGGNTFTLPSLATHPGKTYFIKNIGSGNLTLARSGSDNIYNTSSVTSITIAAGAAVIVVATSSYWVIE